MHTMAAISHLGDMLVVDIPESDVGGISEGQHSNTLRETWRIHFTVNQELISLKKHDENTSR